jgi:tripartite-type tricarboxylate transporter receptor subunit TctC
MFGNGTPWIAKALLVGTLSVLGAPTFGQAYPNRQVEIIVPFPPGGTTDFVTRLIGRKLSETWNQPVVIVNRPGASGALGAELAAQAPGDGYTLLVTGYTNRLLLFAAQPPAPNPAKDMVPITLVGKAPLFLLANPQFPVRSVQELIAQAKAKPGSLNYASIGPGSPSHLTMEMLKQVAGVNLTHVPYKGSAPALTDVIAGHVPLMFDSAVSASPHVKGGKLRALAVTSAKRLPSFPDVPTVIESGLPGFDVFTWTALYAPAGIAPDRAERLRNDVARVLAMPDVVEAFAAQGALVAEPMTPPQVAAFIDEDIKRWRKVIKDADIRIDN